MNASRFHPWVPDVARGVRAAVATLLPFYFAHAFGRSELVWMALGGWLGTLADPGGTRATRAKVLAIFALAGALAVTVAELASGSMIGAAVVLATSAFLASLLRPLGAAAWTPGTLLVVVVAVGSSRGGPLQPHDGLFFTLGAAWALVLTSVVWPVWNYLPLRRAIAQVFAELADHALAIEERVTDNTSEGDERWVTLARHRHRAVRDAIEVARALGLADRARRTGESRVGSNLRVLLGLAESQLTLLVTLAQELEAQAPSARPEKEVRRLDALAETYCAIERTLITPVLRTEATPQNPSDANARTAEHEPTPLSAPGGRPPIRVLLSRLATSSTSAYALVRALDASLDVSPEGGAPEKPPTALQSLRMDVRRLVDALTSESTFVRHGLRVAGAVTVASLVGQAISSHPHWVTVTTLSVLQPYPGSTMSRAAQRVVGTVLGGLVAVVITMTVHAPLALAFVMFPLSVAAVATQPRSYRLFTFFLTPVFVLLAEQAPGDWWVAAARAGDAAVGGTIALVAALLVFPSREGAVRLPEALSRMLAAIADYSDVALASFPRPREHAAEARVAAARRAAGLAIGEAETSLERLLAEPLRKDAGQALALITYARRAASALTALDTYAVTGLASASASAMLHDAPRGYVSSVLSRAADLVLHPALVEPIVEPELTADVEPHLAAALRRLLRNAALVDAAVAETG